MTDLARGEAILRAACGERVHTAFPMAPLTTFRIGGSAALYVEAESEADLAAASEAVSAADLPLVVIGKGSNVLVSDRGFDGLDGLAFGVAIPATLGGAVRMNAGAHEGEMADVVTAVETYRLRSDRAEQLPADRVGFTYRRSELAEDAIVIGATLGLREGDPGAIRVAMDEARSWRRRTQPLAEPNCGSVFRNPPNDHAARLIESAGLKGFGLGGVQVSRKHANFIVAAPGATAEDVRTAIAHIQHEVEAHAGVWLEPEVQMIGEFDRAAG